ncbi:MAG: 2'-5' RNA ligase family protein [Promethearchaeota archaeon]|nr:MAG: 2'-5' RNA ligase family protein [Candidatus Lokiarchaeota archaeon]
MTKVHTSAVVIIPPREKWEPIQKIRRRHDKKVDRWMPHINLIYPFHPRENYESIIEDFTRVCSNFPSFEIKLEKFKFFRHRYQTYTIWLMPEPKKKVKNLQAQILKIVPTCNDLNLFPNGYKPHLSVGQFTTYKIQDQIKKLQDNWDVIRFIVNEIYFITRKNRNDASFSINETIPLESI